MELKYLDSFKSYCVFTDLGVPTLMGGWGWGWVGVGLDGVTPMHMCTCRHAHALTCTHTCMHVKHDKHGCLLGGSHLQFCNMFILVFHACVCVHVHVHMSRDSPCPQVPPTHLLPPQSHREHESPKVYKS